MHKMNDTVYLNLNEDVAVQARFVEERDNMCFCRIKPVLTTEQLHVELAVRVPSTRVFDDSDDAKMTAIEEYKTDITDRQGIVLLAIKAAVFPDKQCERYRCLMEAIRQLKTEIP